jgi:hypothetical protein
MAGKPPAKTDEPQEGTVVAAALGHGDRDGDHLSQYLQRDEVDPEVTKAQTHAAIIHQILASADADSVLEVFEPQSLNDFENRHLRIDSYRVQDSDFEQGPPVYFSLMVVDVDNDSKHLINTGEQAVMAQVLRMEQLGQIPFECRVHLSGSTNRYGRRLARLAKWVNPNG